MVSPRRAVIRARSNGGVPVTFDPERFRLNVAALDFGIEEAKRIKDWPKLEEAVDLKMEQLVGFVNWWTTNVIDKGGRPPKTDFRPEISFISATKAKELTGVGTVQKHRMTIRLRTPETYRRSLLGAAYIEAQLAEPHHRAQWTGKNEWHTPEEYPELARAVLGKIDLDPASNEIAQKIVGAKKFYKYVSRTNNGLTKPWRGRVWLNPPFSPDEIAAFVVKLCEEYEAGRTTAAIMLGSNYTDSGWFQKLAGYASAISFPKKRIRFVDKDGIFSSPTNGQAFFYLGKSPAKFIKVFGPLGFAVKPVR